VDEEKKKKGIRNNRAQLKQRADRNGLKEKLGTEKGTILVWVPVKRGVVQSASEQEAEELKVTKRKSQRATNGKKKKKSVHGTVKPTKEAKPRNGSGGVLFEKIATCLKIHTTRLPQALVRPWELATLIWGCSLLGGHHRREKEKTDSPRKRNRFCVVSPIGSDRAEFNW